jgi:hypothetical protein
VPYLYVLRVNALGYLLEAAHIHDNKMVFLFIDGLKMVKKYFVDDLLQC